MRAVFIASTRDHPRVRGEQRLIINIWVRASGSSPRARGAGGALVLAEGVQGIIPACAGSRSTKGTCKREIRDHPRVRGEQAWRCASQGSPSGSSPRARGAAPSGSPGFGPIGIIPACAGSRTCPLPLSGLPWDHPRVRGEQEVRSVLRAQVRGSSPRARGAGCAPRCGHRAGGIIPACAGSRCRTARTGPRGWDHPRVRGEQSATTSVVGVDLGSSPRARGAVFLTCNAIPTDPSFLQVVEKQTNQTPLNPSARVPHPST